MRDNKGFSLVELIVIIAIMAILAGLVGMGLGAVTGSKVKECEKNIEAVLNKVRVSTLGKDAVVVKIYKNSDGSYYADTITTTEGIDSTVTKKLGAASVIVSYSYKDDYSERTTLESGSPIIISFDRSSGELKADSNGNYCQRIWITNGSGAKEKTITIYKETGNVEID